MIAPPPVRTPLSASIVFAVVASLACKGSDGPPRPPPGAPGANGPAARADAAAPGGSGAACTNDDGCGFALVCTSGRCADSACHDGDPMHPPRVCPGSKHCEFTDRGGARKGRGHCVSGVPEAAPGGGEGGAPVPPAAAP